ncbi:hypothetical protein HNP99_002983 [Flavobacterium sp. 28A]|uniref:DUF4833 domain-containing protein n=1 Tax=Flavobacterium sp. 28A TaxID=2735895 RepID=UPI00156F8704|nr:DUF4833 domain-containing protein [Flavobacterium sp. 28A]NRT16612.1 hypothetical protein [Flavobacterium sp. 28A]
MKFILPFLFLLFYSHSCFAQEGYPEPEKTTSRLFYIQHSNNHNTYVYDANIKDGVINSTVPIDEYQIVYTENGIKKPLSIIQRKLAYGMILEESKTNSYKLRLAASDKLYFYLNYNHNKGARIHVIVNNHKMYLDKMFVQLKDGFLGLQAKADFVLFYGKDFSSGKTIIEKVIID